jgi:hypothetical protein
MMPIVPTALVRITRYYLLTGALYLVLTLALGIAAALAEDGYLPTIETSLLWYAGLLGWVSFPVMGAFYQFFPTLQGRDLGMERWSFVQYGLVNLGLLGMLGSLWLGLGPLLGLFTLVYTLGALLLVLILVGGNLDPARVTLTLGFYVAALFYFLAGLALLSLLNLGFTPFGGRALVSHLVLVGWAVMAIFGAQYIMVPMLQLKTLVWEPLSRLQFYIANLGVLGLAAGFALGRSPLIAAGGALFFLAIALFAAVIFRTVFTGPSRMAGLDLTVKHYLAGDAHLVLVALLGIGMALFFWNLRTVHMHLALIGVLTNIIVGAMYHILPFLVWWEVYASKVGEQPVPLLKEIFHYRLANFNFYLWNISLWGMIVGFVLGLYPLVALFGVGMLALAVIFLVDMLGVLVVHRRGRASPAPARPLGPEGLTTVGGANHG